MTPHPPGPVPPSPGPVPPYAVPAAAPPGPIPGPAPGPVLPTDSLHKSVPSSCEKRMKELKLTPGKRIMAPTVPPGTGVKPLQCLTNVFGLELQKDTLIYCYLVSITAELSNKKEATFTKKGREDFIVLDRHEKCIDIFNAGVSQYEEFFIGPNANKLIYDGQNLLYTTVDLFPDVAERAEKKKLFQIDGSTTDNAELASLPLIKLEVFAAQREQINVTRQNLLERTADPNLEVNDRSLTQFLELVLNMKCIRAPKLFGCFEHGKVYCLKPLEQGYSQFDISTNKNDGKILLPGIKKTVHFIEGPSSRGHNNPCLVADSMKAEFHIEETVANKVGRFLKAPVVMNKFDAEKCAQAIKGLQVYSSYTGKIRNLQIEGIHHEGADKARFETPEMRKVTVADYFFEKYRVKLQFPQLNLLICKDRGNKNYYPMELLTVRPNQRVTIAQNVSDGARETKECAVLPNVRQDLIVKGMSAVGLFDDNDELLKDLGIYVYQESVVVRGQILDGTRLKFKTQNATSESGGWRIKDGFQIPAKAPKVWAMYAVCGPRSKMDQRSLTQFAEMFHKQANFKGLRLPAPGEIEVLTRDTISIKLERAAACGCEFIFFITEDNIKDLHDLIKYKEREHQMIIQDSRMNTIAKIVFDRKMLSLDNILAKTNVKLGGVNFTIEDSKFSNEDQLTIGVGQSMPVGAGAVCGNTVVNMVSIGYSSNAYNMNNFAGDFAFSPSGCETIIAVEEIVRDTIKVYKEFRKKEGPKRIVIYRSGATDGAFGDILAHEIPLARSAMANNECTAKLIYIVVTKQHNFRFFRLPEDSTSDRVGSSNKSSGGGSSIKASEANIPPGVMIDQEVTHPSFKQFFLNSHTTLQGSAKTPCYSVLVDDCNATMDRLENMTYALCHGHQIVQLTTSLPTPLYVAYEYAKRGKNIWKENLNWSKMPEKIANHEEVTKAITSQLRYADTRLFHQRVNA